MANRKFLQAFQTSKGMRRIPGAAWHFASAPSPQSSSYLSDEEQKGVYKALTEGRKGIYKTLNEKGLTLDVKSSNLLISAKPNMIFGLISDYWTSFRKRDDGLQQEEAQALLDSNQKLLRRNWKWLSLSLTSTRPGAPIPGLTVTLRTCLPERRYCFACGLL